MIQIIIEEKLIVDIDWHIDSKKLLVGYNNGTLEEIENDVRKRDYIDSHRDFAPLKCAPDAITLDTSFMTVEEVVNAIIEIINKKLKEKEENNA